MNELDNTKAIIRKFEPLLKDLSRYELEILNKMIVNRVNIMNKAESLLAMSEFNVGDRVSWPSRDGNTYTGIIIKLNNKTASVKVDDSGYWNVSPQLLRKE